MDTAMCKEDQKLMDLWNESHKTIFTHSAKMEILNTMHFKKLKEHIMTTFTQRTITKRGWDG